MSHNVDNPDVVGEHNAKFLAPKGDLHPAAGNIVKQEQIYLTGLNVGGELAKRANQRLAYLSDPETITLAKKAYDDVITEAKKVYDINIAPAVKAYEETITPIWQEYNLRKTELDEAFDSTISEFKKTFDAAVTPALAAYNSVLDTGENMDEILSDTVIAFARRYTSYSGSVKALRSQQITKREASQGAGAALPTSEPKRSLWDKLTGKNKPAAEPV